MKLSIITCTYNSGKFIQECINSVISQNLNPAIYEHIFIDAFSSDNTIEIIEKYQKSYPQVSISLIQKGPKGIYNAMNEGIRQAKGEYVLLLNSDDYLEKNSLNDYLDFIEKTGNKDLYYGKIQGVKDGTIIFTMPFRNIYQQGLRKNILGFICYIMHPATIYKKNLHSLFGEYSEHNKVVSDWEFWIKISGNNTIKTLFYDKIITNHRIHNDSMTNNPNNKLLFTKESQVLRKQYYTFPMLQIMNLVEYLYKLIFR